MKSNLHPHGNQPMNEKKILIIDDNSAWRYLVIHELQKQGYTTFSANNGIAGIETAKQNKPDLILLDILMPGIDGFEVCRILKKDPLLKNIPIVFITAKAHKTDVILGLESGGTSYIVKPVKLEVILQKIIELIGEPPA